MDGAKQVLLGNWAILTNMSKGRLFVFEGINGLGAQIQYDGCGV
jgi:hypothetical protein